MNKGVLVIFTKIFLIIANIKAALRVIHLSFSLVNYTQQFVHNIILHGPYILFIKTIKIIISIQIIFIR